MVYPTFKGLWWLCTVIDCPLVYCKLVVCECTYLKHVEAGLLTPWYTVSKGGHYRDTLSRWIFSFIQLIVVTRYRFIGIADIPVIKQIFCSPLGRISTEPRGVPCLMRASTCSCSSREHEWQPHLDWPVTIFFNWFIHWLKFSSKKKLKS